MPKYYRFRATTPTRKARSIREKDIKKEVQKTEKSEKSEKPENLFEDILDLTLCGPSSSWYLRRTAWREGPTVRQLAAMAGAGRPVVVIKLRSQDISRYL